MEIIRLDKSYSTEAAPVVAAFRCALSGYKGIQSKPDIQAAETEILEYLEAGWPVYAAVEDGKIAGHLVCRIEGTILWVEQIYVCEDFRRRGVASMLFEKAEEIAASMGEDTVYNFVHPNNAGMIEFLRAKGYTVLNMIEIRKPYRGEKLTTTVRVNDKVFDY